MCNTTFNQEVIAARNKIGTGEVLWIPSLIGLGSRLSEDYSPLIKFINKEASKCLSSVPVRFQTAQKDMLMKTIQSGSSLITIIINKSGGAKQVTLDFGTQIREGKLLYSNKQGKQTGNTISISDEETLVIEWK